MDGNQAESTNQESDLERSISRNQSVGELSAASEAEIHKPEVTLTTEDGKIQDSASAARKTASFKPISFTKYSAAKGAGFNAAVKSGIEKCESLAQQLN